MARHPRQIATSGTMEKLRRQDALDVEIRSARGRTCSLCTTCGTFFHKSLALDLSAQWLCKELQNQKSEAKSKRWYKISVFA